jgi:hypothetical protein
MAKFDRAKARSKEELLNDLQQLCAHSGAGLRMVALDIMGMSESKLSFMVHSKLHTYSKKYRYLFFRQIIIFGIKGLWRTYWSKDAKENVRILS